MQGEATRSILALTSSRDLAASQLSLVTPASLAFVRFPIVARLPCGFQSYGNAKQAILRSWVQVPWLVVVAALVPQVLVTRCG